MNMTLIAKGANRTLSRIDEIASSMHFRLMMKAWDVQFKKMPIVSGRVHLQCLGKMTMGEGVRIASGWRANPVGGGGATIITVRPGAWLSIGDKTGISNAEIFCESRIAIGSNVLIGGGARIYDTDFHSVEWRNRRQHPDPDRKTGAIEIGDDVFIGGGALILKNVTIGQCSVVAANSVVTKNIPPYQVWAGNPARFIRKIG